MKLGYLTEEAYEKLKKDIKENSSRYNSDEEWLQDYFGSYEYFKMSSVSVERFVPYISGDKLTDSQKSEEDLVNVRKMYDAFKTLTPWQASNKYLWTYLCHANSDMRKYIQHRWMESDRENTIEKRFFVTTSGSLLNDNALSRLWWYGYLTYEEGADDPYYLTRILLTNQTICTDVVDTLNRTNRERIKGVLLAIKEFSEGPDFRGSLIDCVRAANRSFNRYAAVSAVDFLEYDEIKALMLGFLKSASSQDA